MKIIPELLSMYTEELYLHTQQNHTTNTSSIQSAAKIRETKQWKVSLPIGDVNNK